MSNEQILDISVVIVYIIGITILGIWVGLRKSKNPESYFLGGRSFGWMLVGFSIFATNIGMGFFVAWTGKAARSGFATLNPELLGGVMLTISAIVFIPLYLRSRLFTIPQFLELRFNRTAKTLFGGIFVCQSILGSPIGMYTAALGVLGLFGWDLSPTNVVLCGIIIACTVGLYAIFGGLTSVVVTDMVQVFIMLAGGILVAGVGLWKVGGIGELYTQLPDHFELLRPHSDAEFPWSAVMTGQMLHSAFFAFCSIAVLQRALGAKDAYNAKCGMLFGAYLKLFGIVLFVIPGLVGVILYKDIPNQDMLYTTMVRDFLPAGLSGLVLAGMIAAMMSSQDSGINAMSAVVAMDIYPLFRKNASNAEAIWVGKGFAALNIIWGIAAAPLFLTMNNALFDLGMTVAGFMVIPSGVCFLFGRFSNRANSYGAVTTLILGLLIGLYYVLAKNFPAAGVPIPDAVRSMHFYHVFPLVFLLLTAVFFGVSYLTPPPAPEKLEVIRPMVQEIETGPRRPLLRSFNFWWILYLAIVVGLYVFI
ncbi:MAG: sodium/solute symporter [Opitutaceae bacterium]